MASSASASDGEDAAATAGERYDVAVHGPIPPRFVAGCKGDTVEAQRRWVVTAEWRQSEGVDRLLAEPHRKFDAIKPCFPQYIHGRALNGCYIYYERPGMADWNGLAQVGGVDELVRHYIYTTEYIWTVLEPSEDGKLVSVWDCTKCSASNLAGDRLKMMRSTMSVISAHYPERSDRLFIINAPFWFSATWRVIAPWIDPNTRKKVKILGTSYQKELLGYLGKENVPVCFGGSDETPLGESEQEKALRAFVEARNNPKAPPSEPEPPRTPQQQQQKASKDPQRVEEASSGRAGQEGGSSGGGGGGGGGDNSGSSGEKQPSHRRQLPAVGESPLSSPSPSPPRRRQLARKGSGLPHDGLPLRRATRRVNSNGSSVGGDDDEDGDASTDYESMNGSLGGTLTGEEEEGLDGDEVFVDDDYELDGNASDTSFLKEFGAGRVTVSEDDEEEEEEDRGGDEGGDNHGDDGGGGGDESNSSVNFSSPVAIASPLSDDDAFGKEAEDATNTPTTMDATTMDATTMHATTMDATTSAANTTPTTTSNTPATPPAPPAPMWAEGDEAAPASVAVSVAELSKVMARVEAAGAEYDRLQGLVAGRYGAAVRDKQRVLDEVQGRRSGLNQQMRCYLEHENGFGTDQPPPALEGSPGATAAAAAANGPGDSRLAAYSSDALPPALAARTQPQISLNLTMQLRRISKEAERLNRRERAARKELQKAKDQLAAVEQEASKALIVKHRASDLFSAVLARQVE